MEEPLSPGGGAGDEGCIGSSSAVGGDSTHDRRRVAEQDELDELWPSRRSRAAAMLAHLWVDNPAESERWSSGLGGVDLDPEIWEVRIQLDGVDNLERRIAREDITYMNIVAVIEEKGFSFQDSIYCTMLGVHELVRNNCKVYELLNHFESSRVLSLFVKRGKPAVVGKNNKSSYNSSEATASSIVVLEEPVPYDWSEPDVYVVDGEGCIFTSQSDEYAPASRGVHVPTQESQNVDKGKAIQNEDSDADDDGSNGSESELDDRWWDIAIGQVDVAHLKEMRKKELKELAERIEERRRKREDPLLHCEGDTDIEDLFVTAEEEVAHELEPAPSSVNKKKLPVKRGPTLRCHSEVEIQEEPDYIPSSDEDKDTGFLEEEDESDNEFQPLLMVPPKDRKSRAKKRPERKWYDDRRLRPHEQLCLKMCFVNVQQFRDALIDLHIA